jgi:hypothetical protein
MKRMLNINRHYACHSTYCYTICSLAIVLSHQILCEEKMREKGEVPYVLRVFISQLKTSTGLTRHSVARNVQIA